MHYLLRKVRRARWDRESATSHPWLGSGECWADCFVDLGTDRGNLSLWGVTLNRDNLSDIVVALAANCDRFSNVDYVLFESDLLKDLGGLTPTPGETPYVRARQWHWDLKELDSSKLADIARRVFSTAEVGRIAETNVKKLLKHKFAEGELDSGALKPSLLQSLKSL
jgi:hypothetical protein